MIFKAPCPSSSFKEHLIHPSSLSTEEKMMAAATNQYKTIQNWDRFILENQGHSPSFLPQQTSVVDGSGIYYYSINHQGD